MKNKYKVCGTYTEIYLYYKGGHVITVIDTEDLDKVMSYKGTWGVNIDPKGKMYVRQRIGNWRHKNLVDIHLHRVITDCPDGLVPDHINGDTLNNRKSNLRVVTQKVNMLNQRRTSNTQSGILGVTWNEPKGKWYARIAIDGKRYSLGYYTCKYEAGRAITIRRKQLGLPIVRKQIKLG